MPTYNSLSSTQIRTLVKSTNPIVGETYFSTAATRIATYKVFGKNPIQEYGAQTDTTGAANQTMETNNSDGLPVYTFYEAVASTADSIPTINLTTNGHSDVIVLNTGAGVNLIDKGSSGDGGDVIYGDGATDQITLTQGANFVAAGSGHTTVTTGSGADTVWGGGNSSIVGGSGSNQKLAGGLFSWAHDTVVAGTGSNITLWAGYGSVVEDGRNASGPETIYTGYQGDDTVFTNGQTDVEIRAGNANVSITGGGNDTIRAADDTSSSGATGDESISTTGGNNFITLGSGTAVVNSAGNDSIDVIYGSYASIKATGSDTVRIGSQVSDDTIIGAGSSATHVVLSSDLNEVSSSAVTLADGSSGTLLLFDNGSTVVYSGNVSIETSKTSF